ncbi:hypothetical protein AcV7_007033 [Taiwanofungus camphoratus]|nr:hypothetical protein AcV7_007033 [Antrodia cinnamomea]
MANKSAILVLAFDICGTLLDTNNITLGIQTHIGLAADKAAQLSQTWRKYQLEYTWRLNSMGLYEPFNVVTRKSLQHAAAELELTLDDKTIAALMDAYSHLLPFDDSVPALVALARLSGLELVIFSNGLYFLLLQYSMRVLATIVTNLEVCTGDRISGSRTPSPTSLFVQKTFPGRRACLAASKRRC